MHRPADALRQRGQYPRPGFDHGDVHVFGFDSVQPISRQLVCGIVQLGRQFNAGSARTHDGNADVFNGVGLACVCAQVMVKQLLMEFFGLFARIQKQAMLSGAQGAEIVGGTAHRNHQRVIAQLACGDQFFAVFIEGCRQ